MDTNKKKEFAKVFLTVMAQMFNGGEYGTANQGSLVALQALGGIDVFLSNAGAGNPDYTLWRSNILKVARFMLDTVRFQPSTGVPRCGNTTTFVLEKSVDAVWRLYLSAKLPGLQGIAAERGSRFPVHPDCVGLEYEEPEAWWANSVGSNLLESANLVVGSSVIGSTTGLFLNLYQEIASPEDARFDELIGNYATLDEVKQASRVDREIIVPLAFHSTSPWTDTGYSQKVTSSRFHKIAVSVKLRSLQDLIQTNMDGVEAVQSSSGTLIGVECLSDVHLIATAVLMDGEERDELSLASFIELVRVQKPLSVVIPAGRVKGTMSLDVNGSISEILWVARQEDNLERNQHIDFNGPDNCDPITHTTMTLNGGVKFSRSALESRVVAPLESARCVPRSKIYLWASGPDCLSSTMTGGINLSRIDRSSICFQLHPSLRDVSVQVVAFVGAAQVVSVSGGLTSARFSL
jgi:hypothetical protein